VSSYRFAITAEPKGDFVAQRYLFAIDTQEAYTDWIQRIKKQVDIAGGKHFDVVLTGEKAKLSGTTVVAENIGQLAHLQAQEELTRTGAPAPGPAPAAAPAPAPAAATAPAAPVHKTDDGLVPTAEPMTAEGSAQVRADAPKALVGKRIQVEGYGAGVVTGITKKAMG
jgi:hypothetical protein